jgi:glyceraldehyde 3-phosphate dehydrogenase
LNDLFKNYADNSLKGILEYTEEQLVSSDILGNTHSSILDGSMTKTIGKMVKVVAWYDNEMGYACRMVDLACILEAKGL